MTSQAREPEGIGICSNWKQQKKPEGRLAWACGLLLDQKSRSQTFLRNWSCCVCEARPGAMLHRWVQRPKA